MYSILLIVRETLNTCNIDGLSAKRAQVAIWPDNKCP